VGAPLGDDDDRLVGVEAAEVRGVDAEDLAHLSRDGGEQLCVRDSAGHQRGHAPQRLLLVGHLRRLQAAWDPRVGGAVVG